MVRAQREGFALNIRLSTPQRQHVVQIAYHVADLDAAVARWRRMLGVGPFLVRRHIALETVRYRGQPTTLDISAAHVQSGDVQIELVQQHGDAPSTFRDMFAASEQGLHHIALFPKDHDALVAHYAALGCVPTTELVTAEQRGATYVDARALTGHMIEIYRVNPSLFALYQAVADAARDWDGRALNFEL